MLVIIVTMKNYDIYCLESHLLILYSQNYAENITTLKPNRQHDYNDLCLYDSQSMQPKFPQVKNQQITERRPAVIGEHKPCLSVSTSPPPLLFTLLALKGDTYVHLLDIVTII